MRRHLLPALSILPGLALAQPGSLDPTFGDAGVVLLQPGFHFEEANAVATLPDNTVMLAGSTWGFFGPDTICGVVVHLLDDGSLDPSFAMGGYAPIIGGERNSLNGMAMIDNSVIVVGSTLEEYDLMDPDPDTQVLLARLSATGALDPGFGTGGLMITDIGSGGDVAVDVAVQADGRIVVAGFSEDANGEKNGVIMRYDPDGTLDGTFSGDGKLVITAWPGEDALNDVVVLSDGSIVGAGYATVGGMRKSMLVKVGTDGSYDSGFGVDGLSVPELSDSTNSATGILIDGDGILVCGKIEESFLQTVAYLARFMNDGTPDPAFNGNGLAIVTGSPHGVALDLALQDDGKVLVCGKTESDDIEPGEFMLARFNTDGSVDDTFGSNGAVSTDITPGPSYAHAIAVRPDGRIVLAGAAWLEYSDIAAARYLADNCAVFPSVSPETPILCPNGTGELSTGTFDTYQWYKNGVPIPGANAQTLPVTAVDDAGSWFKVETSIDTCVGISDSVLVDSYVFLLPFVSNEGDAPNLIGDNGEQIYCQGDDPVLVLGAPYDTNVQWSVNGEPIPGANDTLYAVPGSGSYTVEGAPAICPDFIQDAGVTIVMDFHPYVQPTIYASGILLCPQPEGLSSQWYYNGQPVAGFEQCVIPIDAGSYTVFVDYGDSCSVLSAPFQVVGMDEHARSDMKASPVPTHDRVTITWAGGGSIPGWRVIDVTGRIVRTGMKAASPLTLDLGDLDMGRYRFVTGDGRSLPLAVVR
jgi:uncharacterized delta-60 repeat protein